MNHVSVRDRNLRYALKEATEEKRLTEEGLAGLTRVEWSEYRAEAEMYWQPISDLAGLEYCVNLRELGLDGNAVRNLRPLAGLAHLQEVWLVQNSVKSVEPLGGLAKLKTLVLDMNYHLESVEPLADLPSLEYLNINDTAVTDLTPLTGLPALTRLRWSSRAAMSDVARQTAMSVLEALSTRGVQMEGGAARLMEAQARKP